MSDIFRILISPRDSREIREIHEFVYSQSPQNAAEVVERLLTAIYGLETRPERFKVERRVRRSGYSVRSVISYPFLVYYRVIAEEGIVRILCVQRGSKRRPRSFE